VCDVNLTKQPCASSSIDNVSFLFSGIDCVAWLLYTGDWTHPCVWHAFQLTGACLVIDGRSLSFCTDNFPRQFLEVAMRCPSVVRRLPFFSAKRALTPRHISPWFSTKEPCILVQSVLYSWEKSPVFSAKEPCILGKKALYSIRANEPCIFGKRALYSLQKSLVFSAKETCILGKKALYSRQTTLYSRQKSPTFDKRALYRRQKSPIFLTKQIWGGYDE